MFVNVGPVSELETGELLMVEVGGTAVTLAKVAGEVYAFDDTCTHAGCSLADGELDGTTVTCPVPWQSIRRHFGAVLRGPAERPVRSRAVRMEGHDLLVEG